MYTSPLDEHLANYLDAVYHCLLLMNVLRKRLNSLRTCSIFLNVCQNVPLNEK